MPSSSSSLVVKLLTTTLLLLGGGGGGGFRLPSSSGAPPRPSFAVVVGFQPSLSRHAAAIRARTRTRTLATSPHERIATTPFCVQRPPPPPPPSSSLRRSSSRRGDDDGEEPMCDDNGDGGAAPVFRGDGAAGRGVGRGGDGDYGGSSSTAGGGGRRSFLAGAAASAVSAVATASTSASAVVVPPGAPPSSIYAPLTPPALTWPLGKVAFSLLPLAGTYTRRATVETTIVPDRMWTHDQIQGVVNVNVPVRQTVIKLSDEAGGGLWVHNPVAPTRQLIEMMRELEREHGKVRHVVLGTVALEHKATLGPFAGMFPEATVWLQPGQWSFPVGLPIEFLGVTQRGPRLREIPHTDGTPITRQYRYWSDRHPIPPWSHDIDHETLGPLKFKSVGGYSETAFFHRETKTLLVTDAVVSVTADPPAIIREDPRAMLFHARDSSSDVVVDDEETRRKGWRRMVQFGLIFFPSQIDVVPFGEALSDAAKVDRSMRPLGEGAVPFSLYPWTWHADDADMRNFETISRGGKLFCPPILTKLILDREPKRTLEWVDSVASRFDFTRVIPCHLNNDVMATPAEFREAFEVLASDPASAKVGGRVGRQRPLGEDLALLQKASDLLTDAGVVGPSLVCDGEPARVEGRFAR